MPSCSGASLARPPRPGTGAAGGSPGLRQERFRRLQPAEGGDGLAEAQGGGMLLPLDAALEKLAGLHPRQAKVVERRFFGGLSSAETAEVLGVSKRCVQLDRRAAKAWLQGEFEGLDRNAPASGLRAPPAGTPGSLHPPLTA